MSMAGVAGPMLQRSRRAGVRLLVGLAVGGVLGGLVLAAGLFLAGRLVGAVLPGTVRLLLLAAVAVVFGVADLADRTPHVSRQVPKVLLDRLPAGSLGLVWGFDLGLLFSTQKTVSLLWLSMAAVVLVDPAAAPLALIVWSLVASTAVVAWMLVRRRPLRLGQEVPWIRWIRRMTGVGMLAAAVGVAVTALG